jgi:two-component system response regulator CpxR
VTTRILLIEDDQELNELLSEFLSLENFEVDQAFDGEQGLNMALNGQYDALVLDIMMPKMNGLDLLKQFRANNKTPVLMLTARSDEVDRIVGFEMGADDYLPKPCNPREIVARIRAILRRVEMDKAGMQASGSLQVIVREDVELNHNTRTVSKQGEDLDLTSTEFNLLASLLEKAGQVLSKEELTETALGRKLALYDRSVDMHMSNLRRKLGPFSSNEPRIKTIRGVGYQYVIND